MESTLAQWSASSTEVVFSQAMIAQSDENTPATKNGSRESQAENEIVKPLRLDRRALSGLGLKRVSNAKEPDRELYQTRLFEGTDISAYVVASETATTRQESYGMEEFIQLIAGRARVEPESGEETIFSSGDCFIAPKGYCGEWETQGGDNEYLVELSVITTKRSKEKIDTKPLPVRVDQAKLSGIGLTKLKTENGDEYRDVIFKGPELEVTLYARSSSTFKINEPWSEQLIYVLSGSIKITPQNDEKTDTEDTETFLTGDRFVLPANFKGTCKIDCHGLFRYLAVKKSNPELKSNSEEKPKEKSKAAVEPFDPAKHQGIWRSAGYGYVVEPGNDKNMLVLSSTVDPYEFTLHRIKALPSVCQTPTPDIPQGNFDAFVKFFDNHYAFLDLYGVDWKAVTSEAASSISDETSDKQLFDLMSKLLGSLRDSHIKIKAEVDGVPAVYDGKVGKTELVLRKLAKGKGERPDDMIASFHRDYWLTDIKEKILADKGVVTGNGRVQYGIASNDVGYIAFVSMGGFVDGELSTFKDEVPALDNASAI